jgi:glycerophosphoryl diester phosphodiesterase
MILLCWVGAQPTHANQSPAMSDVAATARDGPIIVAHRGRLEPDQVENSLVQFQKTAVEGPFMLEMDLRASRDGKLFLLHDATLDRTSNAHGPIKIMNNAGLAAVRLRSPNGNAVQDELPDFHSVLHWAQSRKGATLMLDLKDADPTLVVAMVREAGLIRDVVLLTFDETSAKRALAADREVLVSVLVRNAGEIAAYHRLVGNRQVAFYLPQDATQDLFRTAKAVGGLVITDAVTLDPKTNLDAQAQAQGVQAYARYLAEHPVDLLVTDHPREARASLSNSSASKRASSATSSE